VSQLKLLDITTRQEQRLAEPKAKARDPWTAETLDEFRKLWRIRHGRPPSSRDELDFVEAHSELAASEFEDE
jgi:hypothetical protein